MSNERSPLEFFWRLPSSGDIGHAGRGASLRRDWSPAARPAQASFIRDARDGHFDYYDYLAQVARGAELTGFHGLSIGDETSGEEPWIVASVLAAHARTLKILPSFSSAFATAVYAAKMSVSFQRFSHGRLGWHVETATDAETRRKQGDFIDAADIPARTEEFLTVAKGVWTETAFQYQGRFFGVENGGFAPPLAGQPWPEIHLSGQSDTELALSARHADVHLFAGQPIEVIRDSTTALDALARQEGRTVRHGIALRLLGRDSGDEAGTDAARQAARGAPDPDIIGSHGEIADRLAAYVDAGITRFVLTGNQHLEDVYRIGEHVLPAVHAHATARARSAA